MPNWVYNRLRARGSKRALAAFMDALADLDRGASVLDFDRLVIPPRGELVAFDVVVSGDPARGSVDCSFQTPWTAPAEWLQALSRAHPHVELVHEHLEESGDAAGRARLKAGAVLERATLRRGEFDWTTAD